MDFSKEENILPERRAYYIRSSNGNTPDKKIFVRVKRKKSSGNICPVDAKKQKKTLDTKACVTKSGSIQFDEVLFLLEEAVLQSQNLGMRLRLARSTIACSEVLVREFYKFHSFSHKHSLFLPSGAVFLASKICEEVRPLRHIIHGTLYIYGGLTDVTVTVDSKVYKDAEEKVIFYENCLLMTIGFDFQAVTKSCERVFSS